jgi:hypothetical protein
MSIQSSCIGREEEVGVEMKTDTESGLGCGGERREDREKKGC